MPERKTVQAIHSMTGFGRAAATGAGCAVLAEIRSVNNKFFSLKSRLPGPLAFLEPKIDATLRRRVERGTIDLFVKLDITAGTAGWRINDDLLEHYIKTACRLTKEKGVAAEEPEAAELLALPGVIIPEETKALPAAAADLVLGAVDQAAAALCRGRAAEGRRLVAAIRKRGRVLRQTVAKIASRVPRAAAEHKARLVKRVEELLDGQKLAAGDPTLQRELAFLADRLDVTEELDRLQSHFAHFDATLAGGGAMGRPLDFLVQEMGREINTIGAKSSDAPISQLVVQGKAELEKIREQVQNIE